MMTDPLVVTEDGGRVGLVRLGRPDTLGALNAEMLNELDCVIADLSTRPSTRVIVLTGTGDKAFSAGADLDELAGLDPGAAHDVLTRGHAVFGRIDMCPVPVIAPVNGLALRGACDSVPATAFPALAEHAS